MKMKFTKKLNAVDPLLAGLHVYIFFLTWGLFSRRYQTTAHALLTIKFTTYTICTHTYI